MRVKYGLFLSILLALCLSPFWVAQADASYGTRTYASYESITLTPSSSVADAVDWLESFIDVKVGGAMEIATDLMELVELNDENAYALASLDPADRPTTADITEAFKSFESASDFNSEIRFYYDRLIYLYNQNAVNRKQILSGELTPAEVDRLKLEMKANNEEAAPLMTVVINKHAQWINNAADIHGALDGLNTANVYIARIRNQAMVVLADQAAAIAAAEAVAGVQPVVDVISDKEIAVTVTQEDGKTKLGNIRVTLNIKGRQGVTKVTNSNGTAIFWVADFKPNDAGITEVEVSFDGTTDGYQRRELGVMQLSGGDVFHMAMRKDNGKPYIVKATFDDADMLTVANGMYMTPKNDIDHAVELKVETKGKAVNVKAWYWKDSVQWETLLSANFAPGDTAAKMVTRKWVQKGGNGAFPEQKPIYLTIAEGSGLAFAPTFSDQYEKDKTVFLGEKTKQDERVSGKDEPREKTEKILDGFKFILPEDWAVIGGAEIKIPLGTGFDFVMEIGKSLQLGYNYRVEKTEKSFWKSENLKQQEQRLKREKDNNASILKSTANGVKNDYMNHRSERLLGSFKASVTPFLYLELEYTKSRIMNSSIEMRFSRGIFLTPKLLGYDVDEDGNLIINEDEALTVRLCFFLYLYGYSTQQIANTLMELCRMTKKEKQKWTAATVLGVLQNERHCGDVLAHKTWTPDYLNHKSRKNRMNKMQYHHRDHHESIVSRDDFIAVQRLISNAKFGYKGLLPCLHVVEESKI